MEWFENLLRLKDRICYSGAPRQKQSVAMNVARLPADWGDIAGWDRYFQANYSDGPFRVPTAIGARGWQSVRFLGFVRKHGGRVWFPGCGINPGPRFYACVGNTVLATDFSPVAVGVQRRFAELAPEIMFDDWCSYVGGNAPFEECGRFDVAEHDFTSSPPTGVFDVVINCRAFQGLSPSGMTAAARNFFAALRPGGVAFIDTINVQGTARDVLEDSLIDADFYLPFNTSDRWYRAQLESTGIVYGMVIGRPQIPNCGQYPAKQFGEYAKRDHKILESFRAEYEARHAAEESSVSAFLDSPQAKVANVVYCTG